MKLSTDINQNIIYQAKNGAITLKQNASADMLWATQEQIADIFDVQRPAITKHIRNILKDKELNVNSVCAKMEHTAKDGKTYQVQFYNLDVILAVGYRTNSKKAIAFRQWATKTLKDHIYNGYTVNKSRITPPALTAITLLIAESAASDKNKMTGLVCTLLAKRNRH